MIVIARMSPVRPAVVGTSSKRPAAMTHGGNTGATTAAGVGSSSSGCGLNNHSLDVEQRYVKWVDSSSFFGVHLF